MKPFKAMLLAGTAGAGGGGTPTPGVSDRWRIRIFQQQTASRNDPQIAEVQMRATPGGPNLCTGGTPLASSVFGTGFEASKAFDGDNSTRWVGGNPGSSNTYTTPQWIGYQFASPVTVQEVVLTSWDLPDSMPTAFTVEYWDGAQWVVYSLVTTAAWSGTRQTQTLSVAPFAAPDNAAHRYWRVFVLSNSNFSIWLGTNEVEMSETLGGADVTSTSFTIHSTAAMDGSPNNAFDNNLGTSWQSSNGGGFGTSPWHYGRFVGQDFGAGNAKNIKEVRIWPNTLSGIGSTIGPFLLQYSDDNVTWTTKFSGQPSAWVASTPQTFNLEGLQFTSALAIAGTIGTGETLTATYTFVPLDATPSYVWKRNGTVIAGAAAQTYVQQAADAATVITVEVTLTKNGSSVMRTASRALSTATGVASARWRIRSLSSSYLTFGEMEMAASAGGTDQCAGGTVLASSALNSGTGAANAVDNNNATTYHSANGSDHWVEYQFPSSVVVNELRIRCRSDDSQMWQPSSLRLEYWDGTAWALKTEFTITGWSTGTLFTYDVRADDQRVLGGELLLDPEFNDPTKYGAGGGWTITGGQVVASGGTNELKISDISVSTPIVAGKRYQVTFPYTGRSGGNLRLRAGTSGSIYRIFSGGELGSAGTVTYNFTAASNELCFQADAAAINITIPSMSLKELV